MRRVDVIAIGLGVFIAGGLAYWGLQSLGIAPLQAGLWSQVLLVAGLVIWVLTYGLRVITGRMTYDRQLQNYEDAVLEKRLASLTPEELAQIQAEIDQENPDTDP